MVDLRPLLKGRVLILGVGNSLKQDDGAGPALIAALEQNNTNYILIDSQTAPESFCGSIKKHRPDTLIMVDAVDFKANPGEIKVFAAEDTILNSFSTHTLPLKYMVNFIRQDLPDLKVHLVGIQPKLLGFGENLSPEVKEAVEKLCMSLV